MTAPVGYYEGIGGSMCAAIMGMDKMKSPYDAWLNFTDPATREDLSSNEPVLWGQLLELPIGMEAARRLGIQVVHQPKLIKHPSIACMQAHMDFEVVGEPALLEVKARGLHMLRQYDLLTEEIEDEDRVLDTEAIQVHHYLTVSQREKAYLAVLIGGQRLLTFTIKRDPAICAAIELACAEFWGYVERREPPPPINVSDCNRLWPKQAPGKIVEATPEIAALVEKRAQLKAQKKDAETDLEFVDFKIKRFMADAEELRVGGKKLLTWKWQKRPGYTVADGEMRVMR
jgi:putative phage-type endonuclease